MAAWFYGSEKVNDFNAEDIKGNNFNTLDSRGKIIIIGFSTEDTSERAIEWQTKIGYESGITLGGYEQTTIVTVAGCE